MASQLPDLTGVPAHCLALFDRLSAYLDGELPEAERSDLEAHLRDCPKCRVCLTTLTRSVRICNQVEDRPVPHGFSRKLDALARKLAAGKIPPEASGTEDSNPNA